MAHDFSRRYFFYGSLLAGAIPSRGFGSVASLKAAGYKSPNEKLNIASIGAGGKASSDIDGCAHGEHRRAVRRGRQIRRPQIQGIREASRSTKISARCWTRRAKTSTPCIVTIPDFMHATAAIACMERGKHVYVQKPLVRTVAEARMMLEAANKYKVATQMGNQGYSNEGTRQAAEMVWAGEIGNVTEVHAWTDRPWWPQGLTEIPAPDARPATLDWDLWLGNANKRPYTSGGAGYPNQYGNFYQPFNWRGFYDFGCGALGDMACHILGAPNMALRLGAPTSVECISKEGTSSFHVPEEVGDPVRFPGPRQHASGEDFLARRPERSAPDGWRSRRRIVGRPAFRNRACRAAPPRPPAAPNGFVGRVFNWETFEEARSPEAKLSGPNGSLFIGDKGMMTTGTYGEQTRLIPAEEKMKDYKFPEPFLTRSPGHYRDWIRSCKGGDPACSNFNVAVPFVEWMLLGVIALRVEGKLEWDAAKGKFSNSPEANKFLKPAYMKG